MKKPVDERSAMAIALEWSSVVMTISLEMVVPGLVGYWIDQRLGTRVLFLFVGFALGGTLATIALMRIARTRDKRGGADGDDRRSSDSEA